VGLFRKILGVPEPHGPPFEPESFPDSGFLEPGRLHRGDRYNEILDREIEAAEESDCWDRQGRILKESRFHSRNEV